MKGYDSYDAALTFAAKPSTTGDAASSTSVIDLGSLSAIGVRSETFELEVTIPAFTAAELPSNATLTVALKSSNDSAFSSSSDAYSVTFGNGTKFDGDTIRFKPTLGGDRYWKVVVTTTLKSSAVAADTIAAKEVKLAYVC